MRRLSFPIWVLVIACALAAPARAEDVEREAQKLNKRAMDDYDSLEFEASRQKLQEALQQLRSNGLDESATAARTYLNLGVVYINGFKDRGHGQQQFANALKIDARLKVDPAVATPETDEAFAAARRQLAAGGGPAPTSSDVTPPTPNANEVHGLQHSGIDESRPNLPIPVRAKLGADVGATRVFLFYRGSGQEDFVSVPLRNPSGADWVAVIPPEAVVGKSLQYYLEARDARGRAVVGAGSSVNPFIIVISDRAPPPTNVPEVDVEDPLARERMTQRKLKDERHGTRDHVFLFVMPGFGFGVQPAGNHTEVAYQYQNHPDQARFKEWIPQQISKTGVAVAPFHLAIEAGYLITPRFSLSLVGRFELVTGGNAETQKNDATVAATTKSSGAVAGMVRARYRFLDGRFHPYVHLDLGGGEIRQFVDISTANTPGFPLVDKYTADKNNAIGMANGNQQLVCGNPRNCLDTVSLGLFFIGGGAGLWYDIGSHLAFILDLNVLGAIGSGDRQSGLDIDVQVGLGVHFL